MDYVERHTAHTLSVLTIDHGEMRTSQTWEYPVEPLKIMSPRRFSLSASLFPLNPEAHQAETG